MEAHAAGQLRDEGFEGEAVRLLRSADVRYLGQSYELSVPVPDGALTVEAVSNLATEFHRSHERAYGYSRADEKVEFVNLRLVALGKLPRTEIGNEWPAKGDPPSPYGHRKVFFGGQAYNTPVYRREILLPGEPLAGPAVIEQLDSTTIVPPGDRATVEQGGNIIIELEEE
jgi:N-methylhydantoinase A